MKDLVVLEVEGLIETLKVYRAEVLDSFEYPDDFCADMAAFLDNAIASLTQICDEYNPKLFRGAIFGATLTLSRCLECASYPLNTNTNAGAIMRGCALHNRITVTIRNFKLSEDQDGNT